MTYATDAIILASDYNGFANTGSPNVNQVWATGTGNSGYGQPALTTVTQGDLIQASQTANLLQYITDAADHQGSTILPFTISSPSAGDLILPASNVAANITTIYNNRLNADSQGGTSNTTATSASTWNNSLTVTFTVAFANDNAARYFFNAGGQFGFNFSHPNGAGENATIYTICQDAGTVWSSSPISGTATLAGSNYSGVTKVGGGSPGLTTVNTNYGFYAFTGSDVQIFKQEFAAGGTNLTIFARYDGAGTITYTCVFTILLYFYVGGVSVGTQAVLIKRPPSTTYLSNTWGTPVISSNIVAV